MKEDIMRKSLRISIWLIFLMLLIVGLYLLPKLRFVDQMFECVYYFECTVKRIPSL